MCLYIICICNIYVHQIYNVAAICNIRTVVIIDKITLVKPDQCTREKTYYKNEVQENIVFNS